mmetsp:Transcript_29054/g.44941  ORF Transcript_29054/g.44941 Transcript_29054/m.44941 type:complete len:280 (-) Transcript_29054:275-1114(-)
MGSTKIVTVTLLSRTNPDRILRRRFHINILICDVLNKSIIRSKLQIDSLDCVGHVSVTEGHIFDSLRPNRSNCQPKTARLNSFKSNITTVSFDTKRVVLVPHFTIMDPDVVTTHIKTVGVESSEVIESVSLVVVSSGINFAKTDFHAIDAVKPGSPVRRVQEKPMFNQDIGSSINFKQSRSVLSTEKISNTWLPPPSRSLSIQSSKLLRRGKDHILHIIECKTHQNVPIFLPRPVSSFGGECESSVKLKGNIAQIIAHDPSHDIEVHVGWYNKSVPRIH